MGRLLSKKVKPTLAAKLLHNYGRQSIMVPVYVDHVKEPEETKVEEKKASVKKDKVKTEQVKQENNDIVMMDTKQKVELASSVLEEEGKIKAKRIKKDKGLIERKESTIILTEDNRELLRD